MKKIIAGIFVAFSATFLFASSLMAQSVTLSYRWTKGENTVYRMTQRSSGTVSTPMMQMATDQTMTQTFRQIVDDVAADGSATIRQTMESIQFELNTPAGKTSFDSTKGDTPSGPAAAVAVMLGQTITTVIAANGSIQKLDGAQAIFDKIKNTLPNSGTGAGGLNVSNILNEDTIKSMVMQGRPAFPDHPIKLGESWEREQTTTVAGVSISTNETLTLQAIEDNIARIHRTISMKLGGPNTMGPMTIQVGDASGDGELLVDVSSGRLQKTTTQMNIPMTMTMNANGNPVTMSMTQHTSTVMELVQH